MIRPFRIASKISSKLFSESTKFVHLPKVERICESLPDTSIILFVFAKYVARMFEYLSTLLLLKTSIKSQRTAFSRKPLLSPKGCGAQDTAQIGRAHV